MERARVEQILKESNVLLEGHFILTSGKHAGQYMQCAQILQYPAFTKEIVSGLAESFTEDRVDVVVGPATGGIILAYEMAAQLKARNLFAERENGRMTFRRNFKINPGERVLVIEDVVTTGGSVLEVIELVKEAGGILVGVALLVDRSMGKVDFGVKTAAAYVADIAAYEPDDCPLCREGARPAVKPGSRSLK